MSLCIEIASSGRQRGCNISFNRRSFVSVVGWIGPGQVPGKEVKMRHSFTAGRLSAVLVDEYKGPGGYRERWVSVVIRKIQRCTQQLDLVNNKHEQQTKDQDTVGTACRLVRLLLIPSHRATSANPGKSRRGHSYYRGL